MINKIDEQLRRYAWEATIIVAVSGGVDSVVLLHALRQYLPDTKLVVAHVNYHLRKESDGDALFVRQLATTYQAVFEQIDWSIMPSHAVEEQAREFRYRFFVRLAGQYQTKTIVVAHHANDQAETVLLKLIRGGRLEQLAGMSVKKRLVLRPFLGITKQQLITYAQQHHLSWREDDTNFDATYTPRNLLRNIVIPELKTINLQVVNHVNSFAKQIAEQSELISFQAKQYVPLLTKDWTKIPDLWLEVTLAAYLHEQKVYRFKQQQLKHIHQLLINEKKPTGSIQLSHTVVLIKNYRQVYLKKTTEIPNTVQDLPTLMLKLNQWQNFADDVYCWTTNQPVNSDNSFVFGLVDDLPAIYLRPVKTSDKLALIHGHKKLRRLAIDEKLSQNERHDMVVLSTPNDDVIAVRVRQRWRLSADFVSKQDATNYWLAWRIEEK